MMVYGALTSAFSNMVTNRIFMRPIEDGDTTTVLKLLQDADVMRFYGGAMTKEDALLWIDTIKTRLVADTFSYLYMSDRFTGKFIGLGGPTIEVINGIKRIGLGFIISKEYWSTTHAIEALSSITASLMNGYGVKNVMACLKSDDYRSITTVQKIGMTPEFHLLRNTNNHAVEYVIYSVNQSELKDQPVFIHG